MANQIITAEVISKETESQLYNKLVVSKLVNTSFISDFTNGANKGDQIKIKRDLKLKTQYYTNAENFIIQDLVESATYIKVTDHLYVAYKITTHDLTFDIKQFSNYYIEPATSSLAQEIDKNVIRSMFAGTQKFVPGLTGTITTRADLIKVSTAAKKAIKSTQDIRFVVNSETEANILNIDNVVKANERGDGGLSFREANVGRVLGLDTYLSLNIDDVLEEIADSTYTGTAVVSAAADQYETSVKLKGGISGEIIKAGQMLTAGKVSFKAASDSTFNSSGNATVQVVGLTAAIAADTKVTTVEVGGNFVFHKEAVALVVVAPALPIADMLKKIIIEPESGFALRMTVDFSQAQMSDTFVYDAYMGSKVVNPDLIIQC